MIINCRNYNESESDEFNSDFENLKMIQTLNLKVMLKQNYYLIKKNKY